VAHLAAKRSHDRKQQQLFAIRRAAVPAGAFKQAEVSTHAREDAANSTACHCRFQQQISAVAKQKRAASAMLCIYKLGHAGR
jgi:hypothetical protein